MGRGPRVVLLSEVRRTLFDDFARHRATQRGDEEIGWLLLGNREGDEVIVQATLPAGEFREAGVAHVRFNRHAQAIASRIVRQDAKHLVVVGVVHTHPGSLRRPSSGDLLGDREWVRRLHGQQAVFAIGTADARADETPDEHRQIEDGLAFHWYSLSAGDADYRRLPVETRDGPDLAKPLHPHWPTLEEHAEALERLCRVMARVSFSVAATELHVRIGLAEPGDAILLTLSESETACYVQRRHGLYQVDLASAPLDRAVFLVLSELATQTDRTDVSMSR
jgi:proteasome lid subunit RPN8/RPN11